MRYQYLLPLAGLAVAFVIPDQQTLQSLSIEDEQTPQQSIWDKIPQPENFWQHVEDLEDGVSDAIKDVAHGLDQAFDHVSEQTIEFRDNFCASFAGTDWLNTAEYEVDLVDHPPPHQDRLGHGSLAHKRPHHPRHPEANLTVYQLISTSNYTTKLAAAIDEFPDLVELLNGTTSNFTIFAPSDRAFEKIPKDAPKPSKEFLKKILTYHVSPDFYPAGRVLVSRTIPTALEAEAIGKVPQRLSTQISLRGLTVNFYARVVAVNIFGTNGVIHGIDSLLLPPPKVVEIISFLPAEFSTLELALIKTGLYPILNDTTNHSGGTFFAPSNFAFAKLGSRANAFLFSDYGLKYLKALLLYHVVDEVTLYSDAIYKTGSDSAEHGPHIPKGLYHIDLTTGLEGKTLSVDIARYGRLITIKVNGFTRVTVSDGVAADGVIHAVSNVLIPPKNPGLADVFEDEISVEELKQRLEPYVSAEEDERYEIGL